MHLGHWWAVAPLYTTTVQAEVLGQRSELPIALLRGVYRNEAVDATHLAMFHQFEGIWIDKGRPSPI